MPGHRPVGHQHERIVAHLRISKNQASPGPSRSPSVSAGDGASAILQGEGCCVFGLRAIGSRNEAGACSKIQSFRQIAAQVGKTTAQALLAWAVQRGTALLTT